MRPRRGTRALVVAVLAVLFVSCTDGGGGSRRGRGTERMASRARGEALRWQRGGIGMGSWFVPSGGRLLSADAERVYVASGFGAAAPGDQDHTVTALDRNTGQTRWTLSRGGPPFLQGVADGVLLVNEQHNALAGVEASTGAELWSLDLSTIGLGGYGATVSAVSDGVTAVGLSTQSEADTRPPVIAGIDATNGLLRWQATLAPGTDLNFGSPAVVDGAAVFLSTLSHPGSAPGNMAHAVNLNDGAVRWSVELGGGQGFHGIGPVVSPGGVHIPGPGAVITTDPTSGAVRWRRETPPLPAPAVVGDRLWFFTWDGIVALDPFTGQELSSHGDPRQLFGDHVLVAVPGHDVVLAVDRVQGRGLDPRSITVLWSQDWPAALVDLPLVSTDLLVVATGDQGVTAYEIPRLVAMRASPPSSSSAQPQSFTGEERQVAEVVDAWLNGDSVDAAVGAIEGGRRLRSTIRRALKAAPAPLERYSGRVDDVVILGEDDAVITFSILLSGRAVVDHRTGRAVRIDGRWKVSRETYCDLVALGGTSCPSR